MQLPSPVCSYQELNYTVAINNINGSIVLQLDPFYRFASGTVKHSITSGLMRSQDYSVIVTVATVSSVVTSHIHDFS